MNVLTSKPFTGRVDAGEELAEALARDYDSSTAIFGLPRGGIVTAAQVALKLHAPLFPLYVKKIGHPLYPEYAIGAIGERGDATYNLDEVRNLDETWLQEAVEEARRTNELRKKLYKNKSREGSKITGKHVIVIDDGIATGLSMEVAVAKLTAEMPASITVAVPIAPLDAVVRLSTRVDKVILLENPLYFLGSVGAHYRQFDQVSDNDVIGCLQLANQLLR